MGRGWWVGRGPGPGPGRPAGGIAVAAAILGLAVVAGSCREPGNRERAETPDSSGLGSVESTGTALTHTPDRTFLLERRVSGCPICRKMTESLPPGEFAQDAHAFRCAVCHHPHTQKSFPEWRATCAQPDCHPRAWTKTVFHRVEAATFVNCMNCHAVHRWTAQGENCRSCHDPLFAPDTVTAVRRVEGVKIFSHPRHQALRCEECHRWETRHAETLPASKADCMACHHGPRADRTCAECHGGGPMVAARNAEVRMALSVWEKPRSRSLPFSHERHRGVDCAACHGEGRSTPASACASCHEAHHRPEADCTICHRTAPESVHPLSVHEGGCAGSGCHQRPVPAQGTGRNLCLVCHQDQKAHNPEDACADCHRTGPGSPG